MRISHFTFLAIVGMVLVLGCGNKQWPEPQTTEDAIGVESAFGEYEAGCFALDATLSGIENVDRVAVLLDQAGCPECPFTATRRIDVRMGDGVTIDGDTLRLRWCEAVGEVVRWRVGFVNRFPSRGWALSPVFTEQTQ
jgi:hypothetical protein